MYEGDEVDADVSLTISTMILSILPIISFTYKVSFHRCGIFFIYRNWNHLSFSFSIDKY